MTDRLARLHAIAKEFNGRRGEPGQPATIDELCALYPDDASTLRGLLDEGDESDDEPRTMFADLRVRVVDDGELVVERYRIVSSVGVGGMGVVERAHDEDTGRDVALKFVRPELAGSVKARARQLREARTSALVHPNIARVIDFVDGERPFLVLEFIDGRTLHEILADRRSEGVAADGDDVARWVALGADLADALHYAHERGVIHRDIKPGNVIVRPDGSPVLLDFGLALHSEASEMLTTTGEYVGTLAYMAPEQFEGTAGDARSDVYGLGVVLYECLSGERAFTGVSEKAVMAAVVKGDVARLRDVRPGLARDVALVVETAMALDPLDRYATAELLADDLRALVDGRSVAARAPSVARRLLRWAQREPVVATLVAVVFVVGALALLAAEAAIDQRDLAEAAADRADDERDTARRAADDAESQRARAEEALRTTSLLAAQARVEEARAKLDTMQPAWPEMVPEFESWLHELVEPLDEIVPQLESELTALRAGAQPAGGDNVSFLANSYTRILDGIAELRDVYRPAVEEDLAWAREIRTRSIDDHWVKWQEAILSIRESDGELASELYNGLEITPQIGLVPIGMDPESKLWEFVHLRSGERDDEAPDIDPHAGHLIIRPETGLVFVLIPGGTATIGAQSKEPGNAHYDPQAYDFEESPVHTVALDAFFTSKYEMTQAQWARLTQGDWPSHFNVGFENIGGVVVDETHPVENINWHRSKSVLETHGLVLPTEAQWEYAARAGTTTAYFTGESVTSLQGYANILDVTSTLWRRDTGYEQSVEDGYVTRAPVGSFRCNAFGLHDVVGNVNEWCLDAQFRYVYPNREGDGLRLGEGDGRVNRIARGGESMQSGKWRSAARDRARPEVAGGSTGVRPVRSLNR